MLHKLAQIAVLAILTLSAALPAEALTPLPKPEPAADIDPGKALSYEGRWSVSMPTMEVGTPDTKFAICTLPVRIGKANDTHIFYLGPRDTAADTALELKARDGGAIWTPITGGPSFFAIWVNADIFYLYDTLPGPDITLSQPFVYRRCL